jgi:hypothetical protein
VDKWTKKWVGGLLGPVVQGHASWSLIPFHRIQIQNNGSVVPLFPDNTSYLKVSLSQPSDTPAILPIIGPTWTPCRHQCSLLWNSFYVADRLLVPPSPQCKSEGKEATVSPELFMFQWGPREHNKNVSHKSGSSEWPPSSSMSSQIPCPVTWRLCSFYHWWNWGSKVMWLLFTRQRAWN